MDGRSDFAGLHHGELQIFPLGRRRVDDKGGLARAEHGKLAHLTRLVVEVLHRFGLVQHDPQGLDVAGLLDDFPDCGRHGFVGIAGHQRSGREFAQHFAFVVFASITAPSYSFYRS